MYFVVGNRVKLELLEIASCFTLFILDIQPYVFRVFKLSKNKSFLVLWVTRPFLDFLRMYFFDVDRSSPGWDVAITSCSRLNPDEAGLHIEFIF